jgi:hypothetical protein
MSMSEVDCLLCAAHRDAHHLECRSCGQVFEEPVADDPNDASFYFASTTSPVPATAIPISPPKARRRFMFTIRRP